MAVLKRIAGQPSANDRLFHGIARRPGEWIRTTYLDTASERIQVHYASAPRLSERALLERLGLLDPPKS